MKKRRGLFILKVILIIISLVAIWFGYQYFHYQASLNNPVDSKDSAAITFIVKKGQTVQDISLNLSQKNLISREDQKNFELYARLNNLDRNIIPGNFSLARSMTIPEIMTALMDHKQSQITLTIPEGSTIRDIDKELTDQKLIQGGEFIEATKNFKDYESYSFLDKKIQQQLPYPLEGYLFPDTYFIDKNTFTVDQIIEKMLNNFQTKVSPLLKASTHNVHESITMASILEKEVNTSDDMPIVSGIFWKRLDNNWAIGADATLLYMANDREITYQDLQKDTPYNTRKNKGLPPGPIGNPGLETIKAALQPKESPYWFYLTTSDGTVIYAKTDKEHNDNKRKYL